MSNLHYKKDGSLDMRYSSSRAASSSGFSGGSSGGRSSYSGYSGGGSSYSGYGGGTNSYNSNSSAGSGLNYKKDGTLDMRYSSSGAASSSNGGGGSSYSGYSGGANSYNSNSNSGGGLNYKKDGTLDMRYSSSRAASSSNASSYSPSSSNGSGLNYKKDGTLDMRYSSSKAASSSSVGDRSSNLHYKKDGTLDMRYKSSKETENRLNSAFGKIQISPRGDGVIPAHIPLTKSGFPDMRSNVSKQWVAEQSTRSNGIPHWLPRKKDGSLDTSKAVTQHYLSKVGTEQVAQSFNHDFREKYYADLLLNSSTFQDTVDCFRQQPNTSEMLQIPEPCLLADTEVLKRSMKRTNLQEDNSLDQMIASEINYIIPEIDYKDIQIGDEEKANLGNGSFGVVLKGKWNGKIVAVKRLHLSNLNKRDKPMFVKEIKILALIGEHPNLVLLHGYCVKPPCMVMEFVALGSLSHLLHYCEDEPVQAAITDGRVKKKLISGVANGMHQLHEVAVVHGDLKPANVLVDSSYTAKVADFGLATLRGKTSASVASSVTQRDDGGNDVAGTGAYMAPELLDSTGAPDFSVDVYSFGILLNELIQEEEPFSGEEANFLGRGVFGAVNYAKKGKRPNIDVKTPPEVKKLIEACWNSAPSKRPSFNAIISLVSTIKFPNSC